MIINGEKFSVQSVQYGKMDYNSKVERTEKTQWLSKKEITIVKIAAIASLLLVAKAVKVNVVRYVTSQ
ncbi:hypothetical protein GCM10008018_60250 [Paenibacillus marchantiophytorum]|uniref:Uncharacterized protein n=1 Tax=Paenibacillus marchantiophytorum TaxID=1619310 RepID=A0ABQ1FCS4_9BACL|nr:hypothetical protein GCM10008018_60250 [Paenibacillus marchantiophytorum]